ncbi:prenyltransferase/squalene oxidase repeat-containing protein [Catelliglobosispora koreensis]|uniref:prenyltransferase/squalene oxidase repeat-containing protein n=1 Tax=Catelliglobosispora koreensis TaxID=129052 RepID=UPI0003AA55BA|nr:prenyltransferase/squalene oxidase repeat-containing protein [Catelliglobosispora koreensis]
MVDLDAAIGFVVAKGDQVDRARLSYLRTGALPSEDMLAAAEIGQTLAGGWPAFYSGRVPSIDATCFRLAQLDDLGALQRHKARSALHWLASRQRTDGTWQEDESLAHDAPPWAQPGDPEATLYLTAYAAFWLSIGEGYDEHVERAADVLKASLNPDGTWPSFLVTGWLAASVLHRMGAFYESARMTVVLTERVPGMTANDTAWLGASMRRAGYADDDWTLSAARKRLAETQRSDGGWPSDDGELFDVNVTLQAIRACRF